MKNRQHSQFALLAMANRKHNEHRHIRSAIRELLAAELDLKNDVNGTGVAYSFWIGYPKRSPSYEG